MFYQALFVQHQSVENWKQHYAVWLLVYMVGIRPGSITVCPGYEAGASLGPAGLTRPEDETLRWRDITFFRMDNVEGIAVRIQFKFTKGQRNPHDNKMIEGKKEFTFIPIKGSTYEFDLSAILLALAFSRGLFPAKFRTLEDLHGGDDVFLPTVDQVAKQPVFVAATSNTGDLNVKVAMKEGSLNDKLREMCVKVGLLGHNTIYSLRRSAIIETRRATDTEFAKQLAGHGETSHCLAAYDVVGLADVDITSIRLGAEGVSRDAMRDAFAQSRIGRVDEQTGKSSAPSLGSVTGLKEQLEEQTIAAMQADSKYVAIEVELSELLGEIAAQLNIEPLPSIQSTFETYRQLLHEQDLHHSIKVLNDLLYRRKLLRKSLKVKYREETLKKLQEDHKKSLKIAKKQATHPAGQIGSLPGPLRQAVAESGADNAIDTSEQAVIEGLAADNGAEVDDQDDVDLDVGVVEDTTLRASRDQPQEWAGLGDDVVVHMAHNEGDAVGDLAARLHFMSAFAMLTSIPNSNLQCMLCLLDPSVSDEVKNIRYARKKLDRHLKTMFHSRKTQLERAAKNTEQDGKIECPLCEWSFKKNVFAKHLQEDHKEWTEQ